MNRIVPYGVWVVWSLLAPGSLPAADPVKEPLHLQSPVEDKNFYLLSMLERSPEVRQALQADGRLAKLEATKLAGISHAVESCPAEASCFAGSLLWHSDEIEMVAGILQEMYGKNAAIERLVDGPLRQSGLFERYEPRTGPELLAQAWMDAARGINRIIEVYGEGSAPRYPAIDAVSYDVKTPAYLLVLKTILTVIEDDRANLDLWFQPSLRGALHLLDANHRDEAGRLEPLESGENAAAVRNIRTISWSRFPYSVIIVPGAGGDRISFSLSAMGKLRLAIAAKRFREGKAPLVLVSGGFVHPSQTPYAEALEMKKSLIADFGIPAEAILVDPHARHTTTNLRNAARQIYRYGIPFDKKALITTDQQQSQYIEGKPFAERCKSELGYVPYELPARISPFDLEFVPKIESLQADASDPLDP